MYYSQIRKYDVSNGPGVRSTLFVSGCTHNCPNCFNTEYMNFKNGNQWTKEIEEEFVNHIKNTPHVSGVTILGGEPMQQTKDDDLYRLLIKLKSTGKSIWIFSGYTYEEIVQHPLRLRMLEQCDVLVDGRFVDELKDVRLRFRGNSNQRIIDIKNSLMQKQIIELEY